MIRYAQLPLFFDAAQLEAEVDALSAAWLLHFNSAHYEGSWSGLALRAPGGRTDSLLPEAAVAGESFSDTPLLAQCPALRAALASLQCPLQGVRLLKLERGAVVKEHTDAGLNFESGEARLHIPIRTHPLVEFYLDGHRLNLRAGTCWYINASLPHSLANPAPVDRIHLVADCIVNDWLRGQLMREDLPVRSTKDTSEADAQRHREIIATLRASGDPDRLRLAQVLERQGPADSPTSSTQNSPTDDAACSPAS